MKEYYDILNRRKPMEDVGDAFKGQADAMRPMNVGQRREQALMRGFGAGINMGARAIDEAKIRELEEGSRQVAMLDRELKMSTAKNQLKKENYNLFLNENYAGLMQLSDLIQKGEDGKVDILGPELFANFSKIMGEDLGKFSHYKNGYFNFIDKKGEPRTINSMNLLQPLIANLPDDQKQNFKGFLTPLQMKDIDRMYEEKQLKIDKYRAEIDASKASIETNKAHAELYKAQSNPDAIQAEINYKKAQANLLNQKADNVGSGDKKKLFDEIYKANVTYLSEAKTNIENNKKVLGAYDNIGTILSEENADIFRRTGPSIKAAALRFLNPSFDEGTRREAELEMESQPLYLDLKKLFGFNPSNTDIALFIKTLPTIGKDYNANMNAINRRKEEIKKDIFKAEETRKLVEESNYKLLHSHSSIDEIVNNRWDKKVLQDSGKVKIKLKDGSISILDKEKDSKEINNLVSKGLGEIIE